MSEPWVAPERTFVLIGKDLVSIAEASESRATLVE